MQYIAEWAVRRRNPVVTFTTLMHQGVDHYTHRVLGKAKSTWRKIEGRFETLNLTTVNSDSYEMIADSLRGKQKPDLKIAQQAQAANLFSQYTNLNHLSRILAAASPLTPSALYVLPQLAAQIAQNERSVFEFLNQHCETSSCVIGIDVVYDHFIPAMRADIGPGGAYRRLIEAESALSRAEKKLQEIVIKAATLLQLGRVSQRIRLPIETLLFSVTAGTEITRHDAETAIQELIDRKVLLYRRRVDDITVWHGPDVDLARMIAEEASHCLGEQTTATELARLFPPDVYTAPKYNYERSITRFASAQFVMAEHLQDDERRLKLHFQADQQDAMVALVVNSHIKDKEVVDRTDHLPAHFIVAFPQHPIRVEEILADLMAIDTLLHDSKLLESDPLIPHELYELRAESETVLRRTLESLMNPDKGEVTWLSAGNHYQFDDGYSSGELLTNIFKQRFSATPTIRNEQVVRRRVTPTTRSARKRCLLAIIERSGSPALGYLDSTSADASIYRTVFQRTCLYQCMNGTWSWAPPSQLEDPSIRKVWTCLQKFYTRETAAPKRYTDLIEHLTKPPIGLRKGLLPLFLAAGLQAFARSIAIREKIQNRYRYVDDIKPSLIERICDHPSLFHLEVRELIPAQVSVLTEFIILIRGSIDAHEPDLVRGFYDALQQWKNTLPIAALSTKGLGDSADILQPLLKQSPFDPMVFLTCSLPNALNKQPLSRASFTLFRKAKTEIETVTDNLIAKTIKLSQNIFNQRIQEKGLPLLDAAHRWSQVLPFTEEEKSFLDSEARGVFTRAKRGHSNGSDERSFVTALSGIFLGLRFEDWEKQSLLQFEQRLEATVLRIEDVAMRNLNDAQDCDQFVKNRLSEIFTRFSTQIGREKLWRFLQEINLEKT